MRVFNIQQYHNARLFYRMGRWMSLPARSTVWDTYQIIDAFKAAMLEAGIGAAGQIIADGILHRSTYQAKSKEARTVPINCV